MVQLPFAGKSIEEIRQKAMAGRPAGIVGCYSTDIRTVCGMMLQPNASRRPHITEILNSPAVLERQRAPLLSTVRAQGLVPPTS